jgi:CheY-like chemotaxis protein
MANGGRRETQPVRRDSGFRVAKRVLVFEGRPATLTPLVEILEGDGYLVQIATNWDVIAEKLRLFVPHAVLVDLDVRRLLIDHSLARSEFAGFPFGRFPPIVGFSTRKLTAGPKLAALMAKPIIVEELLRVLATIVHDENVRRASATPNASSSR